MSCSLIDHFYELPDPRVRGRTDYPLIEIIFLCISAIISGFDGWCNVPKNLVLNPSVYPAIC